MHYYYLVLFIIIGFFALLDAISIEQRVKNCLLAVVVFLMAFTAGLKFETGVDWYEYQKLFRETPTIDMLLTPDGREKIFGLDVGYGLFMSVVKYLGGSIQAVFFIVAMATSFLVWKSVKYFTDYPIVAMLIYFSLIFFILDMSGIRQGLSLSIFFYAVRHVYKGEFIKYLFCIFLASLFHWTSVILLPVYWILRINMNGTAVVIGCLLCLIIYFLNVEWLYAIVLAILPYINDDQLLGKLATYTTSKSFTSAREINNAMIIVILSQLLLLLLIMWKSQVFRAKYKFFNLFFNMYLLQLICFFAFAEFTEISNRLALYFLLPNVVIIPMFIDVFIGRYGKIVPYVAIFLYCFITARGFLLEMPSYIAYTPYQNYVVYRVMDYRSTGMERLYEHFKTFSVR